MAVNSDQFAVLYLIIMGFLSTVESCIRAINNILESGTADELVICLEKPEALLPTVDPSRPCLFFDNLKRARYDKGEVRFLIFFAIVVDIVLSS